MLVSPALGVTDVHFDYTSFDNSGTPGVDPHFGQNQFNLVNYPSINGNYMMTSTDTHRPEMVANNNNLAEFYNWLQQRYDAHPTKDGNVSADEIHAYVQSNSPTLSSPKWLILNEMSTSLWPSNATYRSWLVATAAKLKDTYGYNVVTYTTFANPSSNAADWQALAAKSYIGIENYLSGAEIMATGHGTDYASRVAWAQAQYVWSKTPYGNLGVATSRLFLGEHFGNTTSTAGWGRAGIASADWDTVLQIRQDAILAANYPGFLAYGWGSNGMLVSETEQLQHEYWYRTRRVMTTQQPQWLCDNTITVGGSVIPLSWGQQLNWLGGVPNASGAVANFYRTNTAARTVTLDGSRTVGTLSFNSAQQYTIAPGTGGTISIDNGASAGSITISQGSDTISAAIKPISHVNLVINGTQLTLSGGIDNAAGKTITKSGSGTLTLTGAQTHAGAATFTASAGVTNFNSDAGPAPTYGLTINANAAVNFGSTQHLNALNVGTGATAILTTTQSPNPSKVIATNTISTSGTGKLDLTNNRLIVRNQTASAVSGMVIVGRAGGAWNGGGIVTSMAAAKTNLMTIGVAPASVALGIASNGTGTWASQTVNGSDVLVRYTYTGDADLNGQIESDDYFLIDHGRATGLTGYVNGDFDYNGRVDGDDYFLIDSNYVDQGSPLGAAAPAASEWSQAVPEPAGLGAIAAVVTMMLAGRRRKSRSGRSLTG